MYMIIITMINITIIRMDSCAGKKDGQVWLVTLEMLATKGLNLPEQSAHV